MRFSTHLVDSNRNRLMRRLMLLAFFGLLSYSAHAHHSFPALYNVDEPIVMEAVVTQFLFRNPHSFIFVDVVGEDEVVNEWHIELAPASVLGRVADAAIGPGDELLLVCYPARDGGRSCGIGFDGGFLRTSDGFLHGDDPRQANQ